MNLFAHYKMPLAVGVTGVILGLLALTVVSGGQTGGREDLAAVTSQQEEVQEESEAPEEILSAPAQIEVQPSTQGASASSGGAAAAAPAEDASMIGVPFVLKDVGEAYLPHFGLTKADFSTIAKSGFDLIEGNFDICADEKDVQFFLDSAHDSGLKVILNAGAGEAEWGYPCDESFSKDQKPVWQKEKVETWVRKWKNHPALYAWDTSNEDGGTFPFGVGGTDPDPEWETTYALSAAQLQQAYRDVKAADPAHPVMIRMNGWYFYDYDENFFRPGNSFGKDVADIVMINAYANVDEYFDDFVATVLLRAARSVYAIDPGVTILPALGVWREPPIWVLPTRDQFINDYQQALKAENLAGIGFFKYGARGSEWYLPEDAPVLWQAIQSLPR